MESIKKLLNNKRVLLILVVVVAVGLYLAFRGEDSGSGSSGNTSSSVSINKDVQNKCLSQVSDATFCQFAGSFANVKAYKVEATVTDGGSSQGLMLANDANGNSQMSVTKDGKEQAQIVKFGGFTYLKTPASPTWYKYGAGASNAPSISDPVKQIVNGDFNKTPEGKSITYKQVGKEACGSLQCYKYEVGEAGQTGFLWFDDQAYLLRRLTSQNSGKNTEMSVTYNSVSISEPTPSQEIK